MARYMIRRKWELQKLIILIQLVLTPVLGLVFTYMRNWNTLKAGSVCNVSMDVMGLLILLALFFSCVKDRNDLSYRTGYFTYLVSITGWALFLDLLCWVFDEIQSLRRWNFIVNEIYFIVGLMLVMIFWLYLVEVSGSEDPRLMRLTKLLNYGAIATLLALLGNIPGKYYFYVTEEGTYVRGPFYLTSQLYNLLLLICVIIMITRMDLTKTKRRALLTFVSAPFTGMVIQNAIYGISVVYIGVLLSLIIIYGYVFIEQNKELADQKYENLQKEKELLEARQEQQRLDTELSLASEIQTHTIPRIFPAFPEREEFTLFASMTPAKEVGGDFYDFFLIDHDHLGLVIADVSGKGIPAALYMMISKTMIKNAATQGMSPKQILETVNDQLCEDADEVQMFVTVWIGILEISSGKMIAANAGHEYPAICRKNGKFEFFKDKHGLVLGAMEGMRYKEYELEFNEGDTLFVYTDGVTEASDPDNHLFGMDNLLKVLNREPDVEVQKLLSMVRADIDDFSMGAEQFDDITMMAFRMDRGK